MQAARMLSRSLPFAIGGIGVELRHEYPKFAESCLPSFILDFILERRIEGVVAGGLFGPRGGRLRKAGVPFHRVHCAIPPSAIDRCQ